MSSALSHQHQAPRREAGLQLPAGPAARTEVRAAPPPQARLSGAQLRDLSTQWRQRAHEDPERAQRIADVLEWLAAQRDAASRAPSLTERLRAGLASWLRH